jgi:hypothetical protein
VDEDDSKLPPAVSRSVDQDIGVLNPDQLRKKIADRAFEIFQNRQREGAPGDETTDWYIAEREIMEAYRSPLREMGPPVWEESPRRGRNGPEK